MTDSGDVFVSCEWLSERTETVQTIDVRPTWEYERGHIPGAVSIPFSAFRDSGDAAKGLLPGANAFAALLEEAGINRDTPLVAYDDEYGVYASRFIVTAEIYGHPILHLLDGDYTAWSWSYPTVRSTPDSQLGSYRLNPPTSSPLITYAEVETARASGAVVVDTRRWAEYRTVHITGAVHLDWRDLVCEWTRRIKPRGEVRTILAEKDITPDRRIVLYCNTARKLSYVYLVLKSLGYPDVAFYEEGITDWASHGGTVETVTG